MGGIYLILKKSQNWDYSIKVWVLAKILVTGGAGFLGFSLSKLLAKEGHEITICDNLFRGKMDEELKELIDLNNVSFVNCDLTKADELSKLEKSYDYVYHLAAIQGTKYFYEIPHKVLRVNILSTINILDWVANRKIKKILFASSSETYAGAMEVFGLSIPTPEDVPLVIENVKNPRRSYAGSKIIGELLFINYARKFKFNMSIVRYHNIYGPRMGYEHVIPEFIVRSLKKEDPFKIFGGKQTRAFCFVDDAIKATKLVMESDKTNNEIIHVGNDKEEITIVDLAKKVFDIAKFHPKLDVRPAPEGSVERRCPDISKLKELTDFEAKISLDGGLRKTYEWYNKYAVLKS